MLMPPGFPKDIIHFILMRTFYNEPVKKICKCYIFSVFDEPRSRGDAERIS